MDRLNPLNDYAFKQIMDKENLIPFLNAILNLGDQKKPVSLELLDNNITFYLFPNFILHIISGRMARRTIY